MSDRAESTPQPPEQPEYERAFRQTFLWRMGRPEDTETLIRFGDLLFTLINEGHCWGPPKDHRTTFVQEVEAAAVALDSLINHLEHVAATPQGSVTKTPETAFCEPASGWAGRLARVLVAMQRAVTAWGQAEA